MKHMAPRVLRCLVLVFAVPLAGPVHAEEATASATPAADPGPKPCSAAAIQQFAFWIGRWDLEWQSREGETQKGTNRVEWLWDRCVVHESFDAPQMGFQGQSWSVYDPATGQWKQTWVDSQGSYLDFTGGMRDGRMVLEREAVLAGGKRRAQRMSFYDLAPDSLTWDWESSDDGGKTWQLRWRIHYKRAGG